MEEIKDSEEYDRLVWPMMTSCRIFACWPERDESDGEKSFWTHLRAFRRFATFVCLTLTALGTSTEVVYFWGQDMNETIECSLITSAFYVTLLRIIVFTIRKKDMLYVVEMMRNDWTRSTYEERLLLRDKCLLAFKLSKFFCISVMMTCFSFITMPIIESIIGEEDHKRLLPFRGYYLFNHTISPVYEATYLFNAIIGAVGCSTIAGATSFSLLTTIHAAAKFAIVQRDFKTINTLDWISNGKLGKCIRRHQECIGFAEKVENTINFLALGQFLISTGLLCFAGFQMTTMMEDKARLMKYTSFLNSAILELFIFSYSGQKIKTESEVIADCAYSSNWIGCSSPLNIKLVTMRSRKPCTITAGKFYDMSLESFLKVLSSSFSYFTLLLAIKDN